ncbi:LapA family protein [Pseudomonas sp. nanlin1]|uniref:LapA family protein n=1 Tax=Pseudomonas sp. nanlin1 TaxID=3040605 RepID=UPI00388FD778
MRNLKQLLLGLILLAVIAVTLLFVLENQQSVALVILGWAGPSLPVSVLVLIALLIGMAIGPLLGWYVALRSKRKLRKALV